MSDFRFGAARSLYRARIHPRVLCSPDDMDRLRKAVRTAMGRKVMTHLSMGHTADISSGLALVSIVIDIERIGDYTKNIYDLAVNHPKRLEVGEYETALQEIEHIALDSFRRSVKAFGFLIPGEVKLFRSEGLDDALEWVAN